MAQRLPKITSYARKLSKDRIRVIAELATIAVTCADLHLSEIDIKRLNLQRVTLSKIYEFLTEELKEKQNQRLIDSVEAVENLWGHGMEDVADRESFATKFDNQSGRTVN
jgi:hypothetical protein